MINKEKIIIMTKLAIYDKNNAGPDKRVNDYFLHDFIYKSNMWTRFSVIIGSFIVIFFYLLHKIFIESVDLFTMDYTQEIKSVGLILAAVLVLYTVLGSFRAVYIHRAAQKRISNYISLLQELNDFNEEPLLTEEAADFDYGTDIVYSGNRD